MTIRYWSQVKPLPHSRVQWLQENLQNLVSDQWYEATPTPNRELISHTRRPLNRWSLRSPWLIYKCAAGLKVMRLHRAGKLCSLTQCMQIFKELCRVSYSKLSRRNFLRLNALSTEHPTNYIVFPNFVISIHIFMLPMFKKPLCSSKKSLLFFVLCPVDKWGTEAVKECVCSCTRMLNCAMINFHAYAFGN